MIRILVADDQPAVRSALRLVLDAEPDLTVVAEAVDGPDAIRAAREHRPDISVVDIRMPRLDGIEVIRSVLATDPTAALIALTTFDLDEYLFGALRAGAAGFLLKDQEPAALVHAVRQVHQGHGLVDPRVTRRLIRRFTLLSGRPAPAGPDPLTPREREVLRQLAKGLSNAEIARVLVDMRIAEHMDVLQELAAAAPADVNVFQAVGELIRHQPQATIVKLAGKARGGGAEVVVAADMAFAALETAGIGQIETLMGIVPGGGGTQYLSDRVGRNRALEIVLTGELFDAATAAAYGWINRAVPGAQLDEYVDRVARNIAALADGVIAQVKHTLPVPELADGLIRENDAWASLVGLPAAQQLMGEALQRGAQTPDGERDLEGLMRSLVH